MTLIHKVCYWSLAGQEVILTGARMFRTFGQFSLNAALLVLFDRMSLQWLILCCLALSLTGSNLLGYTRARLGTSEAVTKRVTGWVMRTVLRRQNQDPETQRAQQ